ncbi:LytR/AlgR family response regulator transcription factor [Larkinella sp. VNQ87]|uniref:LytR/AlgR family response regulator transcription factor n=1 Tax=Larkinella sp. VNQ87 TaxID=3400921 RepID=UPI003C0A35F0
MSKPLRVCIIDDEPLAREGLCFLVAQDPDVEVVGTYAIGQQAVDQIRMLRPDVLFLDIQMPQLDGFELLQQVLETVQPVVVFVTAYEEHALKAFQVRAIDYLLKPFTDDDLHQTLRRAKAYARGQQALQTADEPPLTAVSVKTRRGTERIPVGQIDYIRSLDYYTSVHVGPKKYLLRQSMNALENRLESTGFIRIHRTVLVALRAIQTVEATHLVTTQGVELPVSRAGLSKLKTALRG